MLAFCAFCAFYVFYAFYALCVCVWVCVCLWLCLLNPIVKKKKKMKRFKIVLIPSFTILLTFTIACATLCFFLVFFCLSVSSVIFIISYINYQHLLLSFSFYLRLIIDIFYCLNYSSLLFHLIRTNLANTFCNNYVINVCPRHLF